MSSSSQPTIGESESCYVDPDDRTRVKADSFKDMRFLPVLLGGMDIVFAGIGPSTGIGAFVGDDRNQNQGPFL